MKSVDWMALWWCWMVVMVYKVIGRKDYFGLFNQDDGERGGGGEQGCGEVLWDDG